MGSIKIRLLSFFADSAARGRPAKRKMTTRLKAAHSRTVNVPILLAILALFASIFPLDAYSQSRSISSPATTKPDDAIGKYTGPGSCASTTCHGSIVPRSDNRVLQNEYSIWIVKDKHSKAYAALTLSLIHI